MGHKRINGYFMGDVFCWVNMKKFHAIVAVNQGGQLTNRFAVLVGWVYPEPINIHISILLCRRCTATHSTHMYFDKDNRMCMFLPREIRIFVPLISILLAWVAHEKNENTLTQPLFRMTSVERWIFQVSVSHWHIRFLTDSAYKMIDELFL